MVPCQVRRCPHTLASLVHLSLVCPSLPSCPGGRGLLFPEPGMQAPHLGASLCRYCSLPFTVSLPVGDLPSLPGVDSEDFRIPLRVAHPPRGDSSLLVLLSAPSSAASKEALSSWKTEITFQTHFSLVWVSTRLTLSRAWLIRETDE